MTIFTGAKPLVQTLFKSLRPGDGLILLVFVVFAAGSFWMGGFVGAGEKTAAAAIAVVAIAHREAAVVNLANPSVFNVRGAIGDITVQVANNAIRVLKSSCPNQVCVRQGEAQRPGEMLVCVPNRMVALIRRQETTVVPPASEKTPVESRGDAVTF
jgi:hypothetical protein